MRNAQLDLRQAIYIRIYPENRTNLPSYSELVVPEFKNGFLASRSWRSTSTLSLFVADTYSCRRYT